MDSLFKIYSEYYNLNISKNKFEEELQKQNINELDNKLSIYLYNKINNLLKELAIITNDYPKELRIKLKKIVDSNCYNFNMLNNRIKKMDDLYNDIDKLVRSIKYTKYINKLEEMKSIIKNEDVIKVINKEILKLNTNLLNKKELNQEYYDKLIVNIDNVDKRISNSKKIKTQENENSNTKNNNINKYELYLKKPFEYFDIVKMNIAYKDIDIDDLKEILDYIDGLKEEFKYLFTTTMDPNNKQDIVKMFINFDKLVDKKLKLYDKDKAKVA